MKNSVLTTISISLLAVISMLFLTGLNDSETKLEYRVLAEKTSAAQLQEVLDNGVSQGWKLHTYDGYRGIVIMVKG